MQGDGSAEREAQHKVAHNERDGKPASHSEPSPPTNEAKGALSQWDALRAALEEAQPAFLSIAQAKPTDPSGVSPHPAAENGEQQEQQQHRQEHQHHHQEAAVTRVPVKQEHADQSETPPAPSQQALHPTPEPPQPAPARAPSPPPQQQQATLPTEPGPSSSSSDDELTAPAVAVPSHRAAPDSRQAPTEPRTGDRQVGLLYDDSMELHAGPEHLEQPLRIIQMYATLEAEGLLGRCWRLPTRAASDADLLTSHSPEHIAEIENVFSGRPEENKDDEYIHTGLDLYACKDTAAAARMATGCCVEAVRAVLGGHVQAALAVVRPPGHHAECTRAQGFCFYNNCAVAARVALASEGVGRVLVLDWDVHHGNGIQEVLWEDPNVLYLSIHRDPTNFYPYCAGFKHEVGTGPGLGYNINIPWTKRGMVDADYMAAFDMVVEPVIQAYQPDLIIVAAGYDAAKGDPLGGCRLTPQGYANMTKRLMGYAGGKIVLALEGGYNTRVTADCAAACTRVMLGESPEEIARARAQADSFEQDESCCMVMEPKEREVPLADAIKTLKQVAAIHAPFWPMLAEELVEARWKAHERALKLAKKLR